MLLFVDLHTPNDKMLHSPLIQHIKNRTELSDNDVEIINSVIRVDSFKKGEFISKQGKVSKYSSYVISGCIKTYHTDKGGNDHVVAFAIEDWWAGDLASFITHTPADYSVQCLENSEVIQMSAKTFDELYERIPHFERFFRELIQSAYVQAQKRIVNNFSLTAKERYLLFREKYPQFEQRVPQYLVASYLGITKEFLSKIRREIVYEG